MKVYIKGQIIIFDDDGKKLGNSVHYAFDCKPTEDDFAEISLMSDDSVGITFEEPCTLDVLENRTPLPTPRVETLVSAMMDGIGDNFDLWELYASRDMKESEVA
jgi:hypothetical protein